MEADDEDDDGRRIQPRTGTRVLRVGVSSFKHEQDKTKPTNEQVNQSINQTKTVGQDQEGQEKKKKKKVVARQNVQAVLYHRMEADTVDPE